MQIVDLLNRSMTAEALRFQVISDNIANADTPHFKRSSVVFESALKRAIKNNLNEGSSTLKMHTTHPEHLRSQTLNSSKEIHQIQPQIQLEYDTAYRNDQNNVNIHTEMTDAAKSVLRYNSYANFMSRYFKKISFLLR